LQSHGAVPEWLLGREEPRREAARQEIKEANGQDEVKPVKEDAGESKQHNHVTP
jgi:hypothetical protein